MRIFDIFRKNSGICEVKGALGEPDNLCTRYKLCGAAMDFGICPFAKQFLARKANSDVIVLSPINKSGNEVPMSGFYGVTTELGGEVNKGRYKKS